MAALLLSTLSECLAKTATVTSGTPMVTTIVMLTKLMEIIALSLTLWRPTSGPGKLLPNHAMPLLAKVSTTNATAQVLAGKTISTSWLTVTMVPETTSRLILLNSSTLRLTSKTEAVHSELSLLP